MRLIAAPLILIVATSACSKQPSTREPAVTNTTKAEIVAPASCRIAVVEEALLLSSTVRADSPESELAGLNKYAAEPVITNETVASLAQVRAVAQSVATEETLGALKQAELSTIGACKTIDTPEQHAQDAVDDVIKLLEAKDYSTVLERYTLPSELAEMKSSGNFDEVVARFEGEWGDMMLQRLKKSRQGAPSINDDGSIEFHVMGPVTNAPGIVLVLIDDHWYFPG